MHGVASAPAAADTTAAINDLAETYGAASLNVAAVLCDDHDPSAIAFTFVDVDAAGALTHHDLTFGDLADKSARFARGLASMGIGLSLIHI